MKKGGKNPKAKETIKIAFKEFMKKRAKNPKKYNKISISNLPKNNVGTKNGNWRGGTSKLLKDLRKVNSWKYKKWRNNLLSVFKNKCAICGNKNKLESHHIISISECADAILSEMNGVILCHKCHLKTDGYAGKNKKRNSLSEFMVIIKTIPHQWQYYETPGNWFFTDSGVLCIFVSKMGNEDYENAIAFHEFFEALVCKKNGILEKDISDFDIKYEQEREQGLHSQEDEPGDDSRAPYSTEHCLASGVERVLAASLKINWNEYGEAVISIHK